MLQLMRISFKVCELRLACLRGDLRCATGLSNHWEAAAVESGESLRG